MMTNIIALYIILETILKTGNQTNSIYYRNNCLIPNMFANQTQKTMQIANMKFYPTLTKKLFTNELYPLFQRRSIVMEVFSTVFFCNSPSFCPVFAPWICIIGFYSLLDKVCSFTFGYIYTGA